MFTDKNIKMMIVALTLILVVLIGIELKPSITDAKGEEVIKEEIASTNKKTSLNNEENVVISLNKEDSNVLNGFEVTKEEESVLLNTNDSFYKNKLEVTYFENGTAEVCTRVRAYESFVKNKLDVYGLASHTELFLALLQKESGCDKAITNADIAQSSESIGLAPNTITDPFESIAVGVDYYASLISKYDGQVDARFILQSYNYGEQLVKDAILEEASFNIVYLVEKSKIYKSIYLPEQKRKVNEWRPVGGEYGDFRYVANLFSIYSK